MTAVKEADLGIQESQKDALAERLQAVYSEKQDLTNQIRAIHWSVQGTGASELVQVLAATLLENHTQQSQPTQTQPNRTIQPFGHTNTIAERISLIGKRPPATYNDLKEYSRIPTPPTTTNVTDNAEHLARICEHYSKTVREAIQTAKEAKDETTAHTLIEQLRPAEKLATQLKRFQ